MGAGARRRAHGRRGSKLTSRVAEKLRPTPRRVLGAKPLRLFDAMPQSVAAGRWRLTVPVQPKTWMTFLARRPVGLTKTFELDDIGKAVWESCDGNTSVRAVITELADRYHLNAREVEVATLAFLKTLVQKGLVGIPVEDSA